MADWLENSNPRMLRIMLLAIAALLGIAIFLYFIIPQSRNYSRANENYSFLQQLVKRHSDVGEELLKVKSEIIVLEKKLHGDMAGLPVEQVESYILGHLQKISWKTHVELLSITPSIGKTMQIFQESLFKIKLNAGYFEFFQWLQNINRELGYIVIKEFTIKPINTDLTNPKLSITLTLVSFRIVE